MSDERFEKWADDNLRPADVATWKAGREAWQAAIQAERERCANWLRDNGYQQAGDAIRRGEGV